MRTLTLLLALLGSPLLHAQLSPMDVDIPMRDDKTLSGHVYLPNESDAFPVILIMTPYSKQPYADLGLPLGIGMDIEGSEYAFVVVDMRCRFASLPACAFGSDDGEDGFDVVAWIADQPWSDGNVGMWGPSALGNVQLQTARENPPSLDCIVPLVASPEFFYTNYFPGGNAREEYIDRLDALGFGLSNLLYSNPIYNLVWQIGEPPSYYPDEIPVPTMMIGGWYDHNIQGNLNWFEDMDLMAPASLQGKHRLLIGPWAHGGFGAAYVGSPNQGQLSYPGAAEWSDSLAVRFFDFHLRGVTNGQDADPRIRYFQMGDDVWTTPASVFPAQGSETWYFADQGELSLTAPGASNGSAAMVFDPRDPSPTVGGPTLTDSLGQGPYDQAPDVESRNDVLTFTSPVLQNDFELIGNAVAFLYVSSDRTDTDFMVRLTDVYPDGRSMLVNTGVQRMRFRDTFTSYWDTITPGTIYPVQIELPFTALTFKAGHRIRVNITSSNYPQYSLNLNNGDSMYVAGDTLIATNEVYFNVNSPSQITFPNSILTENEPDVQVQSPSILLYPNPGNALVTLQTDQRLPHPAQITVYNLQGQEVFSQERIPPGLLLQGIDLATDDWPSGTYFVELRTQEEKKVVKLQVLH